MTIPAGTRLGPYEILALIGVGGMGNVYRARDVRLNREIAIKVLADHLARDPDSLARFEREARAIAALAHPNILDVHDIGDEAGVAYFVTELLRGEALRARLTGSPLPWRTAVEIGLAIADGLASAHAHGVVHRDLKPENVFLTFDGRVKILDFGLAQLEPEKSTETSPTVATPTRTGTVMGTFGYMSPEQASGGHADPRSDIFSFGCVLYEMATGKRAFAAGSWQEMLIAIVRDEPKDPADLVPDLPDHLRLVILRCLAKHPESRFESARDLAFALKVAASDSARVPTPPPPKPRLARPAFLLAGSAVVTALVVLGVSAWLHRGGPIGSLAVLPFVNASRDPNAEYLSSGITESVINSLLQLPQLRVIPLASILEYKGGRDPLEAGRLLNVRAVLTGQVTQIGDSLVVQAELTDVNRRSLMWGKRFQEKVADAFAVQERIAQEILKSLRLKLTGEEEQQLAKRYTEDAEAYRLYQWGRLYWNKRTPEGIAKSIDFFQRAIARDPAYSLAYAGLADSLMLVAFYGALPPKEVLPKARDAAMRALEIDPDLAEAHALLADLKYLFEWDWPNAEKEFRRAIELNTNYPTAHQWYASYLAVLKRPEEACAEILRAEELDPLNPVIIMDVGFSCHYPAGEYDKAIEQYRKVLALDANFVLARLYLGLALIRRNDLAQATRRSWVTCTTSSETPTPWACRSGPTGAT